MYRQSHMKIVVGKRKDQGTDRTETLIVLQSTLRQTMREGGREAETGKGASLCTLDLSALFKF